LRTFQRAGRDQGDRAIGAASEVVCDRPSHLVAALGEMEIRRPFVQNVIRVENFSVTDQMDRCARHRHGLSVSSRAGVAGAGEHAAKVAGRHAG
jgi:hypothetical protein